MANLQRQIERIPEDGGQTKGVYLPNNLIRNVLQDMESRENAGEEKVSFAKIIKEILSEYYCFNDPTNKVA